MERWLAAVKISFERDMQLTRQRQTRAEGFTLIEVMVGVAIFAVLSAMVVASIQSNADRNAKLEAQRFIAVVNEVRDEALISGKIITLSVDEKAALYSFDVFGAQESNQGSSDSLFRPRRLHKSVSVKWDILGELEDEEDEFDSNSESIEADLIEQKVFITPLGEITPLEVRFRGEENAFVVALNDEGVLGFNIKPANFF